MHPSRVIAYCPPGKGAPVTTGANHMKLSLLAELQIVNMYGQTGSRRGTVLRDLAWALINSPEFSYRH
jgi:hypothetical protein